MNSEKVKEIKKALGCWQESVMLSTDENYVSHKVYNREILDYINELESENEKLAQAGKRVTEINEELSNTHKKIEEQLKDRIAELEKVYDRQVRIINDLNIEVVKEQKKLPKFAERLKMEFYYQFDELIPSIMADKIDETLKEYISSESNTNSN